MVFPPVADISESDYIQLQSLDFQPWFHDVTMTDLSGKTQTVTLVFFGHLNRATTLPGRRVFCKITQTTLAEVTYSIFHRHYEALDGSMVKFGLRDVARSQQYTPIIEDLITPLIPQPFLDWKGRVKPHWTYLRPFIFATYQHRNKAGESFDAVAVLREIRSVVPTSASPPTSASVSTFALTQFPAIAPKSLNTAIARATRPRPDKKRKRKQSPEQHEDSYDDNEEPIRCKVERSNSIDQVLPLARLETGPSKAVKTKPTVPSSAIRKPPRTSSSTTKSRPTRSFFPSAISAKSTVSAAPPYPPQPAFPPFPDSSPTKNEPRDLYLQKSEEKYEFDQGLAQRVDQIKEHLSSAGGVLDKDRQTKAKNIVREMEKQLWEVLREGEQDLS